MIGPIERVWNYLSQLIADITGSLLLGGWKPVALIVVVCVLAYATLAAPPGNQPVVDDRDRLKSSNRAITRGN